MNKNKILIDIRKWIFDTLNVKELDCDFEFIPISDDVKNNWKNRIVFNHVVVSYNEAIDSYESHDFVGGNLVWCIIDKTYWFFFDSSDRLILVAYGCDKI
jgi:hypothetical protein